MFFSSGKIDILRRGGGGTVVSVRAWSSALVCEPRIPGFESPISADHFSIFDIIAEWPKTTQICHTILRRDLQR